jgi:hypothetical protein
MEKLDLPAVLTVTETIKRQLQRGVLLAGRFAKGAADQLVIKGRFRRGVADAGPSCCTLAHKPHHRHTP